jgi:hypothetical protein
MNNAVEDGSNIKAMDGESFEKVGGRIQGHPFSNDGKGLFIGERHPGGAPDSKAKVVVKIREKIVALIQEGKIFRGYRRGFEKFL